MRGTPSDGKLESHVQHMLQRSTKSQKRVQYGQYQTRKYNTITFRWSCVCVQNVEAPAMGLGARANCPTGDAAHFTCAVFVTCLHPNKQC